MERRGKQVSSSRICQLLGAPIWVAQQRATKPAVKSCNCLRGTAAATEDLLLAMALGLCLLGGDLRQLRGGTSGVPQDLPASTGTDSHWSPGLPSKNPPFFPSQSAGCSVLCVMHALSACHQSGQAGYLLKAGAVGDQRLKVSA